MGNSISQHQLTAFLSLKAGQFFVGVKSCLAAAMSCLSLFGLFSLNSEIMEKVKPKPESASVPAAEFVWRLAEEATAFQVVNAVEVKWTRADERNVEWDKVITVAVKPDQRLFDRLVQTVHHPWPDAFPGLCQ
jgi:hypothetical protein